VQAADTACGGWCRRACAQELAELKVRVKSKSFLAPWSPTERGEGAAPADKTRMEYVIRRKTHLTKSMILLYGWLARLEFPRPELEATIHEMVKDAPRLLQALIEYCLQRRWLQPILASLELCQCVVQQLAPWDSVRGRDLLQLPHFGAEQVRHCCSKSNKVFSTKQFIEKTAEERASILRTLSEKQIDDIEATIAAMPHFDIEYQAFVKGDDDDVATKLFELCKAEETKMKGEESDEEDEDADLVFIPEDDDDDGERHLPWESTKGIRGVKDILLESNFGFTAENVKNALEEMELVSTPDSHHARRLDTDLYPPFSVCLALETHVASCVFVCQAGCRVADQNEDGTIDYSKFVKIAAKQVVDCPRPKAACCYIC
jgi:hypothetical protein